MRKYNAIDLMKLHALGSANGWNEFLTECLQKHDVNRLAKVMYQIQAGMDDLAKGKLNTPEMNEWYVRLLKSIEKTMKGILRAKYPNPLDQPLNANNREWAGAKWKDIKKARDLEFEKFLRESSY